MFVFFAVYHGFDFAQLWAEFWIIIQHNSWNPFFGHFSSPPYFFNLTSERLCRTESQRVRWNDLKYFCKPLLDPEEVASWKRLIHNATPAAVQSEQGDQISLEWTPGQHTHSYIYKYTESDTVNTHVVITCVRTHSSSTTVQTRMTLPTHTQGQYNTSIGCKSSEKTLLYHTPIPLPLPTPHPRPAAMATKLDVCCLFSVVQGLPGPQGPIGPPGEKVSFL